MDVKEYFDLCSKHDWFYSFSDDFGKYNRGKSNEVYLKSYFIYNPIYEQIYNDWSLFYTLTKPRLEDYLKEQHE